MKMVFKSFNKFGTKILDVDNNETCEKNQSENFRILGLGKMKNLPKFQIFKQ
jgi:hypothetical protein